jgi:hypothetical protein
MRTSQKQVLWCRTRMFDLNREFTDTMRSGWHHVITTENFTLSGKSPELMPMASSLRYG